MNDRFVRKVMTTLKVSQVVSQRAIGHLISTRDKTLTTRRIDTWSPFIPQSYGTTLTPLSVVVSNLYNMFLYYTKDPFLDPFLIQK